MSLWIPSRGPLSAHKTPFLQLNTYGLSAFQLFLYHPSPPVALPSLPFLFLLVLVLGKLDTLHMGQGQRGIRRSALQKDLNLVPSHRCSTWKTECTFPLQRDWEKTAEEKKEESDSFLETWSQDFGATCSASMTSWTFLIICFWWILSDWDLR